MTTIHHATSAKATRLGFELSTVPHGDSDHVVASWNPGHGDPLAFPAPDAKSALHLAEVGRTLWLEYKEASFAFEGTDFVVRHSDREEPVLRSASALDVGLADIVEACVALDLPLSEREEDTKSVVVQQHYKDEYAARGNRNHSGDWLALTLEGAFTNDEGKIVTERFTACLVANGVELVGKWAALPESGQKGWEGRYRMNGRQKLELRILQTGRLLLNDAEIAAPLDWLLAKADKHPKIECEWAVEDMEG